MLTPPSANSTVRPAWKSPETRIDEALICGDPTYSQLRGIGSGAGADRRLARESVGFLVRQYSVAADSRGDEAATIKRVADLVKRRGEGWAALGRGYCEGGLIGCRRRCGCCR